jgi:predicted nicotinamide N-methyase
VILVGDITYERRMAERPSLGCGSRTTPGIPVLVRDPGRGYFPRVGLVRLAEYHALTTRELRDMKVKNTGVWSFSA